MVWEQAAALQRLNMAHHDPRYIRRKPQRISGKTTVLGARKNSGSQIPKSDNRNILTLYQ